MAEKYIAEIEEALREPFIALIGLGEEWNISPKAGESEGCKRVMRDLQAHPEYRWLLPYFYKIWTDDVLIRAYENLFRMVEKKNYYVVATTINPSFIPYVKEGRYVMPCGSDRMLQKKEGLSESGNEQAFLHGLEAYAKGEITMEEIPFVKDAEGNAVPFNNVYAPAYDEQEYLPAWGEYTKWIQNTMNRKICILELGAGMLFPNVIRFPFEKMTYFNFKAKCFRVNAHLYQLTDEMAARGVSVPMHSVELFQSI